MFENASNWKLASALGEDRLGVERLAILLNKLDDLVSEVTKCAVVVVLEDMVLIGGHFKKLGFKRLVDRVLLSDSNGCSN